MSALGLRERDEKVRLRSLLQLYTELSRLSDSGHALKRAAHWVVQEGGYLGAMVWRLETRGYQLMPGPLALSAAASHGKPLSMERWVLTRAYRENLSVRALFGRQVLIGDGMGVLLKPHLVEREAHALGSAWGVRGVASLPLWFGGQPLAVLALWSEHALVDEDLAWLEHLAGILEGGVMHSLVHERSSEHVLGHARQRHAAELLFEESITPVAFVDPIDGRLLRVNEQMASFLGYSDVHALSAMSLLDLKIGERADSGARMIYRTIESGRLSVEEAAFRRADGRVAFAKVSARHLPVGENPFEESSADGVIVLMLADTTERRAARGAIQQAYDRLNAYVEDLKRTSASVIRERQRAEEANRLKSEFLANLSHELRTPMNAIIGFTERVLKTGQERLSAREQRNLNIVLRNANRLLEMINELLDLARLDADRMEIKPELIEVRDLLEECAELTEQLVATKPIQVLVSCPQGLKIESDRTKIRQILLNLLSNAAKFTNDGSITLSATRLEALEGSTEEGVAMAVEDTGIGIKPENLDLIFDAFRQVDGSFTRKEGGTGLGLAISSRLAELLGGRMSVHSEFGQGTTFVFHCPMEPPRRLVERGQRLGA